MLSVTYDCALSMSDAVSTYAAEAGWRLSTLLRVRKYYDTKAVLRLYKSHILSYIEGGTAAIYHAAPYILRQLNDIQRSLLNTLDLTDEVVLLEHNVAPLAMRRDIAMLGLLYKVAHGLAAPPLQDLFPASQRSLTSFGFGPQPVHEWQLVDPVEPTHPNIIRRSVFGLIRIFNRLPAHTVAAKSVNHFQKILQRAAKDRAKSGDHTWQLMYCAIWHFSI